MGEIESIRDIARRLVDEYRRKRHQYSAVFYAPVPADVQAAMEILNEPKFDGIDKEFLRNMGIQI